MKLSIVIPTLNEIDNIGRLLDCLKNQEDVEHEVIVSDGGSSDGTAKLVSEKGAKLVAGSKGRAGQLNRGAFEAINPLILFLHADTVLPHSQVLKNALRKFQEEQIEGRMVAGHFGLTFTDTEKKGFGHYHFEQKSLCNRLESVNGDQGMLFYKRDFDLVGGFDDSLNFLEDQKFSRAFQRMGGQWISLGELVETSARRFEVEGFSQRVTFSALIMCFYNIGWDKFFNRAHELYREQNKTGRLKVHPFYKFSWHLLNEEEESKRWKIVIAMGRYIRQNAWQIPFFVENYLTYYYGFKTRRGTQICDRYVAPLIDFKIFDWITTLLMLVWFFSSWIKHYFIERKSLVEENIIQTEE